MTFFNGWGLNVSRLQSYYEETVYFLPLVAFSIVIYKSSASTNADSAYITGYFVQSYIE